MFTPRLKRGEVVFSRAVRMLLYAEDEMAVAPWFDHVSNCLCGMGIITFY